MGHCFTNKLKATYKKSGKSEKTKNDPEKVDIKWS